MANQRIVLAIAIAALLAPLSAQKLDMDLQRAVQKETTTGDLKAAIAEYKKIVARAGSDRGVAAKALLHMAEAYQKTGDAESRKIYEQLVKDYADQKDAVAQARMKLAAMGGAPSGGRPTTEQLADHGWGDGFPDGTPVDRPLVPFGSATGDLMLGDLVTGESRKLTPSASSPQEGGSVVRTAISDDGKMVIYAWWDKSREKSEIRSVNTDGTGVVHTYLSQTGTPAPFFPIPVAISPDKKTAIVVLGTPGHRVLELLSLVDNSLKPFGSFARLTPFATAHFSPDGQQSRCLWSGILF